MKKPTSKSVSYHSDLHKCALCEYYSMHPHASYCRLLDMTVKPEGGCNRFERREKTTLRGVAESGLES